jgi:hypothetical protein
MADASESEAKQHEAQFLTTEHFVLQTARSGTIQEANGRANLFVTSVSSATVALGFVAQVTQMGEGFLFFALIILPPLYFIGSVSLVRAVQVAIEDMVNARAMARIRHYYVERAPAVQRYLMHSTHDDYVGMLRSFGFQSSILQSFMTTAGLVNVVNGVIAGVFTGLGVKAAFGSLLAVGTASGICVFFVSVALWRRYQVRAWTRGEQNLTVLFPSDG